MFWKIVIGIAVITVSTLVTSFTITTPMCCVNMGLPFSMQVQMATGVDTSKMRGMYWWSIILWTIVNLAIAVCVYFFVPTFYGYMVLAGAVLTILRSFVPSGINASNLEDWFASSMKYLSDDELDTVAEYILRRFPR